MNNFHYIGVLLDSLYGLELDEEDLEEYGLSAWEKIGNKNTKLYKYVACIDPTDNSVTLPCNALDLDNDDCIELVTALYEDWSRVTNKNELGDQNTSFIEQSIEAEKYYLSPYYLPGKVLKYEKVKDKLYFTRNYGKVNILYKGILSDDEGLPELSNKEATAIATYIAYILKFKEGLQTNNPDIMKLSEILFNLWSKQCDLARVRLLSQNDWDSILDACSSWDRKRYGIGLKAFK